MYTFKSLTWALLIGTVAPLTGFASGIDAGGQGVRITPISAPATSGMADMSDAEGKVEISMWRHAVINFPHPLLRQGLVILDTPGLNAIGSEPELTLKRVLTATAIAPMRTQAKKHTSQGWQLGSQIATRSPLCMPIFLNAAASATLSWFRLSGEQGLRSSNNAPGRCCVL